MNAAHKKALTVAESAAYLNKSTKTVRRYLKRGLVEHKVIQGKFGPEIRVPKKGLDRILKQMSMASKGDRDPLKVLRLFRNASPEIQELVTKILKSSRHEEAKVSRGGFLRPFFRKKGGERA